MTYTPRPEERIDLTSFLEAVHARVSLVDIVSQVVPLRRMGRSFRGACPFHPNAKNPNFDVNPTRHTYHCYVCGKTGTAIRFVWEHTAFPARSVGDAVRYLAERAGIPEPQRSGFDAAAALETPLGVAEELDELFLGGTVGFEACEHACGRVHRAGDSADAGCARQRRLCPTTR